MLCEQVVRARTPSLRTAGAGSRPGAFSAPRRAQPEPALLAAILERLDGEDRRRARHRRVLVVAATGAVVLARRCVRPSR